MRKNKNTRYCLFLFVVSLPFAVTAQQKKYDLVTEAGTGFIHVHTDDSLLSPGKTNGSGIQFHLRLIKTGTKRKTSLEAAYTDARYPNNSKETNNNNLHQYSFGLNLSDGFNILPKKNKHFRLYEGYRVSTQAGYSPGNAAVSYSWNSYHTIGWYQSLRYAGKKNAADLDIHVPLVGVVYRPPEGFQSGSKNFDRVLNSVYSNPAFASLHNYRSVDISLRYTHMISDRLGLSANYQFRYRQWRDENAFTGSSNLAGISIGYHIK